MRRQFRAFTLIELLVVISIIALLIAILLPSLSAARMAARKLQSNTQMRGMHQGIVIYSQTNKGYFPGWDQSRGTGNPWNWQSDLTNRPSTHVETRTSLLLEDDLVTPEYLIHPAEVGPQVPFDASQHNEFNVNHYSYAMLEVGVHNNTSHRRHLKQSWQDTANSRTVIMGDRVVQTPAGGDWANPDAYFNIYSGSSGGLEIGLVFNDNHVEFINQGTVDTTEYDVVRNRNDFVYSRHDNTSAWPDFEQSPQVAGSNGLVGNTMLVASGWERLLQVHD